MDATVPLTDLVGRLSRACDLAAGFPECTSMRTAVLAERLAATCAVDRDAAFWAGALRYIGCTATAHETAPFAAGDDRAFLAAFQDVDFGRPSSVMQAVFTRLASAAPLRERVAGVLGFLAWPAGMRVIPAAHCEMAVTLVDGLELAEGTRVALGQIYERADGKGEPQGKVTAHPLAAVLHVAQVIEVVHRLFGPEAIVPALDARVGGHLDADVVRAAQASLGALLFGLESPVETFFAVEPQPRRVGAVETIAGVFADLSDAKTPCTVGHSRRVAAIASEAARALGLDPAPLRVAGLLHDIGRVAIANGVWEKPKWGALERERAEEHAAFTDRILAGPAALAGPREIAAAAHERLDATGYPRRIGAASIDLSARVLAAADVWVALHEERPHREAHSSASAVALLEKESIDGRLDRTAVRAVITASGAKAPVVREARPFGLTDREIEVLGWVALGLTAKEVATRLGLSTRTAENHTRAVYAKLGVTTRAAAGVIAVRNGLLPARGGAVPI